MISRARILPGTLGRVSASEAVALCAGSVLVFAAICATRLTQETAWVRFWDNVHWTAAYTFAAIMAGLSWRRASGSQRRPRLWFALALVSYAIGQVLWDIQVYVGWNPFPGPSDAFFILLGPLLALGYLSQFRGQLTRIGLVAASLDIAMIAFASLSASLALYLPMTRPDAAFTTAVYTAYPTVWLSALGAGISVAIALRLSPTAGNVLLLVTTLVNGLLWMRWNYLTLQNGLGDGTWFNYSFSIVALLTGLGVCLWDSSPSMSPRWDRTCSALQRVLPLVLVLVAVLSIVFGGGLAPEAQFAAELGIVTVVTLAIIRQSLLLHEQDRLLAAEQRLQESQTRYRIVADNTYDWEFWLDPSGAYRYVSPSCERISGYTAQDFESNAQILAEMIHAEDRAGYLEHAAGLLHDRREGRHEFRIQREDGGERWIEQVCHPVFGSSGAFLGIRGSNRDISERKRTETEQENLRIQLIQAQKMETVGQLAGGVAHDFNNILQVIGGYTDIAAGSLDGDHPARQSLDEIARAAVRAENLVRQLLAFSRRQIMQPQQLDVNEVISQALKMLGRVIGENIRIEFAPASGIGTVLADRGMLEQILMNVCVNARDAMGTHGSLSITTGNALLDAEFCTPCPWAEPGEYVSIIIADTGCGMSAETLARIFEPFFTTKDKSKGTGLGLATSYGIVHQHSGVIRARSELGAGSAFEIYLPRVEPEAQAPAVQGAESAAGGAETILLSEDDDAVRQLVTQTLEHAGYRIIATRDGAEALIAFEERGSEIDLLLFDVVMPRLGGPEAFQSIERTRPGIPALFCSGYNESEMHTDFVLNNGMMLIQKPFSPADLLHRVREVLERASQPK